MSVEFAIATLRQYSKEIAKQMSKYEDYQFSCKAIEKIERLTNFSPEMFKRPSLLAENGKRQRLITIENFSLPENATVKEICGKAYEFVNKISKK